MAKGKEPKPAETRPSSSDRSIAVRRVVEHETLSAPRASGRTRFRLSVEAIRSHYAIESRDGLGGALRRADVGTGCRASTGRSGRSTAAPQRRQWQRQRCDRCRPVARVGRDEDAHHELSTPFQVHHALRTPRGVSAGRGWVRRNNPHLGTSGSRQIRASLLFLCAVQGGLLGLGADWSPVRLAHEGALPGSMTLAIAYPTVD
jgi:hypothetical protein